VKSVCGAISFKASGPVVKSVCGAIAFNVSGPVVKSVCGAIAFNASGPVVNMVCGAFAVRLIGPVVNTVTGCRLGTAVCLTAGAAVPADGPFEPIATAHASAATLAASEALGEDNLRGRFRHVDVQRIEDCQGGRSTADDDRARHDGTRLQSGRHLNLHVRA